MKHNKAPELLGTFQTADENTLRRIKDIEDTITGWFAYDADVDLVHLVDQVLALAGLMLTVDSTYNRACIQARA